MKKLLLAALLTLSLSANAGLVAETVNQGGGSIVLTDTKCTTIKDTFVAYSYLSNGKSLLGCWSTDGASRVFIKWSDGDLTSYPISIFGEPTNPQGKKYL